MAKRKGKKLKDRYRKISPENFHDEVNMREEPMYPTLHLKMKDIPEAKDWKIGDDYEICIKVRQHAASEENVTFKVREVKPYGGKS